jgi:nitrile hydratase
MSGVHDIGGLPGFGPITGHSKQEPTFHEPWEGRTYGMMIAMSRHGVLEPGGLRPAIEGLDPEDYLSLTYYEKWLKALETGLLAKGFLTIEELDAKTAALADDPNAAIPRLEDPPFREQIQGILYSHNDPHIEAGITPGFQAGDNVTVLDIEPIGHSRLPDYLKNKAGTIVRFWGVHHFYDTQPPGVEAPPQPIYNVRFSSDALWGADAEGNSDVYVDMWEGYLAPAA